MSTPSTANLVLCPAPETLGKLLREELDPPEIAPVEEHVGDCLHCQRVLGQLVGSLPELPDVLSSALAPRGRNEDEEPPDFPGYTSLNRIDAGGMGVVWRVRDRQFGRDLAVKVMASGGRASPRRIERFLAEARICAQLTHPFIVPVHAMSRLPDGRPYYTMKLVEGRTLAALLEQGAASAERRMEFVQIFDKVCQAMAFAHGRGVIHRDLKPANVMVGTHGEVQLMDWGLAKMLGEPEPDPFEETEPTESAQTRVGSVLGTAAYMAPEQAQGLIAEVDRQSDVFGLGGILCRILIGEPPFTGPTAEAICQRAAAADLGETLARLHASGADPELIQLAECCLAPRKADRPADASAVASRLAAYQTGVRERLRQAELERAAAQAKAVAERAARWRTRVLAAAVLALGMLAAGGGLWLQHQSNERRAERARQEDTLRQEVAVDLDKAIRFRETGDFDFSRHLLEQTEKRLAEDGPDDLRNQVKWCLADTALARRLDHARQQASSWVNGQLDFAGAKREYAAALKEFNLGEQGETPEEVGARVRNSAVRAEIVAALDDWASMTQDNARRAWVLAVARAADPDPLRDQLRQPALWRDREALMRLAQRPAADPLSPQLAIALAYALRNRGGDPLPLLRKAQARHPSDFWLNLSLGDALYQSKKWDESIGYSRAALASRPRSTVVHNNLGLALSNIGQVEAAIGHYEEALRLDPQNAMAHGNLGLALCNKGQEAAALRHFEEVLRLDPKNAEIHNNIGLVLSKSGQVEAAIGHYEEALRLNPKDVIAHNNLGNVLKDRGRVETAIGHYEEALRINPKYAKAHYGLGNVFFARGQLADARRHYEEAIRLDPAYAEAHCNRGHLLLRQGRIEEALTSLRQGHRLGSAKRGWRYPSAQWVQRAERLQVLDRKLSAVRRGEEQPADAGEQLGLAEICAFKKQYADAARFFADAFAAQPRLAEDLQAGRRYNAACAAALAGCDQGEDAARLSIAEKAKLLRQAREWLDAELTLRAMQLTRDRNAAEKILRHWLKDLDFAGVRDPAALARLPEPERQAWRSLWQRVEQLLEMRGK